MVMALWFCEIRVREMLNVGIHASHHMKNPFLNHNERKRQVVVNIDQLLQEQQQAVYLMAAPKKKMNALDAGNSKR
jgi:hypothetical protein